MSEWDAFPVASAAKVTIPPVGRALLDTIAGSESPGYNTLYGGGQFEGYSDHPRKMVPITSGPNAGKNSSAAGRYQFLGSTWDQVRQEAGLSDFSPENQDAGAWHLATKTYRQKTGRDLETDLTNAKGNPNAVEGIGRMLSGVWTSLPGGIEPNRATSSFASRFDQGPSDVSAQSRAAGWDAFPLAPPSSGAEGPPDIGLPSLSDTGGRFTDNPGQNFRTAREGLPPPVAGVAALEGASAVAKPSSITEKLTQAWENPAPGGLLSTVKPIVQGVGTLVRAAGGDVPVVGEDGRTNPAIIEASWEAAKGLTPAVGAPMPRAMGAVLPSKQPAPQAAVAPTTQELKAAAKAGFESAPVKELEVAPRAISELGQGVRGRLTEAGLDENLAPKTFGILSKLDKIPEDAVVTGQNLQSLRRTFQMAAGSIDKTERLAASKVIEAIDDFLPNVAARDILSGDARAASEAWQLARGNYAAAMRSEDIAKAVLKAQRQAESAGSGANIDNATRQQFKAILNNDKKLRGFNADEVAQMEAIVRGTSTGNLARLVGKAAPTGIVSGALSGGAGLAAGGPAGAVMLPLAGLIGKRIGDKSTAKQVARLDELVRSRAPLMKAMEDLAAKQAAVQAEGQNARTMSALAIASRNLASNLKDSGISLTATDIMRSLQAPVTSRADQDQ